MALKRKPPKGNVRRVHSNGKTITGVITNHQNELVQFESTSEQILALQLLRDRSIKRLVSQPVEIQYIDDNGKKRKYTPDYFVEKIDGKKELHEFTLSKRRIEDSSIFREKAAKIFCSQKGWHYIVHTELDFPSETWKENINALYGFVSLGYKNEIVSQQIILILKNKNSATYRFLINHFPSELDFNIGIINGTLLHMVYWGAISTELNQPIFINGEINQNMELWISPIKEFPYGNYG